MIVLLLAAQMKRRFDRQVRGSGGTSTSLLPQLLREGAAPAKPQTWLAAQVELRPPVCRNSYGRARLLPSRKPGCGSGGTSPFRWGGILVQVRKAGFPAAKICGEFRMPGALCVRQGPSAGVGFREFTAVEARRSCAVWGMYLSRQCRNRISGTSIPHTDRAQLTC